MASKDTIPKKIKYTVPVFQELNRIASASVKVIAFQNFINCSTVITTKKVIISNGN